MIVGKIPFLSQLSYLPFQFSARKATLWIRWKFLFAVSALSRLSFWQCNNFNQGQLRLFRANQDWFVNKSSWGCSFHKPIKLSVKIVHSKAVEHYSKDFFNKHFAVAYVQQINRKSSFVLFFFFIPYVGPMVDLPISLCQGKVLSVVMICVGWPNSLCLCFPQSYIKCTNVDYVSQR